jgi:hypothetical protein
LTIASPVVPHWLADAAKAKADKHLTN